MLDAGSLHQGTRDLAGEIDYLVASEKFARQFSGTDDLQIALQMEWEALLRYASATAALTCTSLGARPALPNAKQVKQLLNLDR